MWAKEKLHYVLGILDSFQELKEEDKNVGKTMINEDVVKFIRQIE